MEHGLVMYRTLKCLEKFDKLKLHFSTTTGSVGCFCTRRKIEQFRCRKKSEMVWKWSVYGELCLYIVRSYGHILSNTSINTISPDLTLIYDTENTKQDSHWLQIIWKMFCFNSWTGFPKQHKLWCTKF